MNNASTLGPKWPWKLLPARLRAVADRAEGGNRQAVLAEEQGANRVVGVGITYDQFRAVDRSIRPVSAAVLVVDGQPAKLGIRGRLGQELDLQRFRGSRCVAAARRR